MKKNSATEIESLYKLLGLGTMGIIVAGIGAVWLGRYGIKRTINNITKILMAEPYDRNLMEFFSATKRVGFQNIVENSMRAEEGKLIKRPLGSPRKFLHFDELMFNIAQLDQLPTEKNINIDTTVMVGPKAAKPLVIDIPIIVDGMAFGTALSEKTKVAIAKGTAMAGTATNTGEAGMLLSERKAAKYLILQYPRGNWAKDKKTLKMADMIEIQIGQGALAGTSHSVKSKDLDKKSRQVMGLKKNEDATINAILPEIKNGSTLKSVVDAIKEVTGGIPVGCKIGAGKYLEKDIEVAINAGVDFINVNGAQSGTNGGPPILQDDFGLPTLYALSRAAQLIEKSGLKGQVSLLISGGLNTPGDYLKALALGASAICIGTSALFAVSHNQVFQAMPFEPPTQVVWNTGVFKKQLSINKGAKSLFKFLISCTLEMEEGVRALGKTAIKEIDKKDLIALTKETSEITGVELAY